MKMKMNMHTTSNIIELVCPDRVVGVWEMYFRVDGKEVHPKVRCLSQWGAEVVLDGWIFYGDQDDMEGFPNEGSYYLTRSSRSSPFPWTFNGL